MVHQLLSARLPLKPMMTKKLMTYCQLEPLMKLMSLHRTTNTGGFSNTALQVSHDYKTINVLTFPFQLSNMYIANHNIDYAIT